MFDIFEQNFNSKFELIRNITDCLEKDGFVTYNQRIYIFDIVRGKELFKQGSSDYHKNFQHLNNQWQAATKAETKEDGSVISLSELNDQNKPFMVIQMGGRNLKGTYNTKDYFYDDLEEICGMLRESYDLYIRQRVNEHLSKLQNA